MRIGLLTDVHEAVENLRPALEILGTQHLDVIVQMGDACDLFGPGRGTGEVATLLAAAGVIGTWGNHDVGFCHDVPDEIRKRAEPHVLAYMAGMRPRLELADCHFSHLDPHLDPFDPLALWMASDKPDTPEKAAPSFAAVEQRILFMGHYHRWLVVSDQERVEWDALSPLTLQGQRRYLVVVGPLVSGHFGVYDTDSGILTPFRC